MDIQDNSSRTVLLVITEPQRRITNRAAVDKTLKMFMVICENVSPQWNIALNLALSLYCRSSLRQKSNCEVMEPIKRQMNHEPVKHFLIVVIF